MAKHLVTGGANDPLLPLIRDAINSADEIELAVAFIKSSGLELLFPALQEAVVERGAKLTLLTSDYLDVTDSQALRDLMLLADRGADTRVFQTSGNDSFHLKAYIFVRRHSENGLDGVAFVGSSNISRPALTDGIEWNYRVQSDTNSGDVEGFHEIRAEFARLLTHPAVTSLTYEWIADYELRRTLIVPAVAPGATDPESRTPTPNKIQGYALEALAASRAAGYKRGLVVLATGLGKTYLAAFDAREMGVHRVLFVAHREEILLQAEKTFLRIHPHAKVGSFGNGARDTEADLLFASVQTLGRAAHLGTFAPDHFDYVVVDEFHHAHATTYRRLLQHFTPQFLLGLTATPKRTDQSDILSLCDNNLVFERNLVVGVTEGYLCPFTYFGIYDTTVEYDHIPWRNGKFDPESLTNKLATTARFKHVLKVWREKGTKRTLAFCSSKKHAKFMADQFAAAGVRAAAVYENSGIARDASLALLKSGELEVIFSVDLFSEGVDIPEVDTVLMLRPTESQVLFLQQLGRGLRKCPGKERLVILDFIGNHRAFLNKPQALFNIESNFRALARFARQARDRSLPLPPGCFVNYDLEIIDFLQALAGDGPTVDYQNLKATLSRRPSLTEYFHSGASLTKMRQTAGSWWGLVRDAEDLDAQESECFARHQEFLRDVETTRFEKCFKAVLLESLLDLDGFATPPTLDVLATQALAVFRRRPPFIADLPADFQDIDSIAQDDWRRYWDRNPVNAWIGGNLQSPETAWFQVADSRFCPKFTVPAEELQTFSGMLQQIVEYRLANYRRNLNHNPQHTPDDGTEIPLFANLNIACGHFRGGDTTVGTFKRLPARYGPLRANLHFIARASGDSMNGGQQPIRNGDYMLLERNRRPSLTPQDGTTVVVARPSTIGSDEYVLRTAVAHIDGTTAMRPQNPDPEYREFVFDSSMESVATLVRILDPLDLVIGEEFKRPDIPGLFGVQFSPGNWHSGHVRLPAQKAHVLLVTLNKRGQSSDHRYVDRFDDTGRKFYWQSQNATTPTGARGRELINHVANGVSVHLFVRESKMSSPGISGAFRYYGRVTYATHAGSAPINFEWTLDR